MTDLEKKSVKQEVRGAFCCQNCQIAFSVFDGIFQPEKHTGGAECLWEGSSVFTSEGIKYSNKKYTWVGYPILGVFRVQVPENL